MAIKEYDGEKCIVCGERALLVLSLGDIRTGDLDTLKLDPSIKKEKIREFLCFCDRHGAIFIKDNNLRFP